MYNSVLGYRFLEVSGSDNECREGNAVVVEGENESERRMLAFGSQYGSGYGGLDLAHD